MKFVFKVGKAAKFLPRTSLGALYKSMVVWNEAEERFATGFLHGRGNTSLRLGDLLHNTLTSLPIYFMSLFHHPKKFKVEIG